MSLSIEEELEKTGKPKKLLREQMGPTMPRNNTGDQNSSARLVAVSESGNHLVSFSNSIVFTTSFALTDHYGKPNFTKKTVLGLNRFSRFWRPIGAVPLTILGHPAKETRRVIIRQGHLAPDPATS
jgi:hypothetical protein